MKKAVIFTVIIVVQFFFAHMCSAGIFDNIKNVFIRSSQVKPDNDTIISALKQAISIATDNAVQSTSQLDGYLGNQAIKILIPAKIKRITNGLGKIGYQQQVDNFVRSMNRAAESAAPQAKSFFVDAIKEMTFEDAGKVLDGGDTAATDYFKIKTSEKLYNAFKPVISSNVNEVGVTRYYKVLTSKVAYLPFIKPETLDLDHYVTNKALEGLYYMMGEEEKKIRTDPAARVTELLKKVFEK